MKPLCNDEDFRALIDHEQIQILNTILELIVEYFEGNIDLDELIDSIENVEIPF